MNSQEMITDQVLQGSLREQAEKGPDLRQLHPKSHGLLHGEFKVRDDIPDQYKIGVFANPKTYPIWVRLSNGSALKTRGVFKPDTEGDIRGLAIKLMNIQGEKVLDDEQETQDFILVNHHVFFLPNVEGYIDFTRFRKQSAEGNVDAELMEKLQPSLAILKEINQKIVGNPLLITYWSTTPYKLGDYAIKFLVKPHSPETPPAILPDSANYLREAIVKYFKNTEQSVKWDFQIQVYVDDDKTPVENPMKEWDSPHITVATIEISKQAFDFEERKRCDESLSFSPWHTLPEHEPLGSVNLARKKIYLEIAKARREYMNKLSQEPQPYSSIQDAPK